MDSYFKAAVCDLDKLLDDFEQNTDELESCRTVVSAPDVNHHTFSSELLYFQQEIHMPKLQHSVGPPTTVEPSYALRTTPKKASLEELNASQNGKNVTGLDLLSTVDGGTSDEIQPSSLGRGGVPVCDLISDTENLIHTTGSPDSGQEPQTDFPAGKDYLTDMDSSSMPAAVCAQPSGYGGHSGTQDHKVGTITLQDELHVAVGEVTLLNLKTDGHVSFKPLKPCLDESETTFLNEKQHIKNTSPIPENLSISNADDVSMNLRREPVETVDHRIKEKGLERADYKMNSNDDVVSFEVPKTSDACKASAGFRSEEFETSDFSNQEHDGAAKGKDQVVEEHWRVSELRNLNATLKEVTSAPSRSTEEIHSSLSCLPIAVSLCGSLVATEDTDPIVHPEEDRRVVSDGIYVHAGMDNSVISDSVLYGTPEHCEDDEDGESLNQVNQIFMGKDMDIQLDKNGAAKERDVVDLCHPQVIPAFPGVPDSEQPVNDVIQQFNEEDGTEVASICTETISQDLKFDHDLLTCDILISDAELDAFLNEQTVPIYNPNPFDEGLSEPDARHSGFLYIEDSTSMEQNVGGKNETIVDGVVCSSDGAIGLIDVECELNKQTLADQPGTESGGSHFLYEAVKHTPEITEVQISAGSNLMVHGGARPKQLFDLPPRMIGDGELRKQTPPCTVAAMIEKQMVKCGDSKVVPMDAENSCDMSDNLNSSGLEINLEAEESLDSVNAEHVSVDVAGVTLGQKQPSWVPDSEASNCMNCQVKFTFTKRRHHCRACGKVFCAVCCNRKCKLQYMEKEARVCVVCHDSISKGPKEQKRVWFADGVLPNGELADTTKLSSGSKRSSEDHSPVSPILPESLMVTSPAIDAFASSDVRANDETEKLHGPASAGAFTVASSSDYRMLCGVEKCVSKDISLIPEDEAGLPPLLLATGEKGGDAMVEERPCHKQLMSLLEEGGPDPLTFILNANLLVNVKLVSYSSEKCWFFSTNGLHGVGQAELIILLLCLPHEDTLPKDIFKLFLSIYKDALKGKHINNLENVTFSESFLGSKDHGGFLFITPTFQTLDELPLPNTPFLCGILIQKMEVPWAKVFPIRVMLRLGAEYGVYPCPLVSIRNRKPLYGEIGHTIMNLLADLRNYQYTLPNIDGLVIHMEMGTSCIKLPYKRYNEVLKLIHSSNEHVISIGASFSMQADSHLVCVQNDDGVYQTQANSSTGQPRKVTGASFVIFNGALKTSSGFLAKSSIVEDGLMVQITPETMEGLQQALREKKDFRIACGKVDAGELREDVNICWVDAEDRTNRGVISPIDGQSLEGILSAKIIQEGDFETNDKLVKCTEVFYLLRSRDLSATLAYYEIAKEIATACSAALCEHLRTLKENGMNKVALRISMDIDVVEYQAGSGGHLLPQRFLNYLDGALIPVIHGRTSDSSNLPFVMELMFFLLENLF